MQTFHDPTPGTRSRRAWNVAGNEFREPWSERIEWLEKGGKAVADSAKPKGWSPYLAGALSGLVSILSVWAAGKYLGASTTFVKTTGMIERFFDATRVEKMAYFVKELPAIDWQWMFVVGIFFGSLIASKTDGSFRWTALPDMWERRFGKSRLLRGVAAFSGGVVAMFGARLADG